MATTEERLAALEAKMAQLTDTTPTTYYTHQYSGEEIDSAVGRAVSGGALDTSVTNVSNQLGTFVRPNLLDNWYFANPVNQRGQTDYTEAEYTIDRWRSVLRVTIASNLITLQASGTFSQFAQTFELQLAGKIVTMSMLIRAHSNHNVGLLLYDYANYKAYSPNFNAVPTANQWLLVSTSFRVADDAPDRLTFIFYPDQTDAGDQTVDILAAKLELGSTQTLAHQDAGGNWILNEIPDYGEQLRRCQRYFVNFNPYKMNWFAMPPAVSSNTTQAYSSVTLPVAMRAQPVIAYGGNIVLSQDADHAVTSMIVSEQTFTGNSIQLRYDVSAGTLTANSLYRVQGYQDATSYIWLSADL